MNCFIYAISAYGKVYLARKKDGFYEGKLFAMKVLKKATIVQRAKTTQHTMTERQVLEAVRSCPFLVTLHWAFQTDSKLHLVMGMFLFIEYLFENGVNVIFCLVIPNELLCP